MERPVDAMDPTMRTRGTLPLVLAGAAALLASSCCVVPLVFAIVGISGAWISRLRVLEPYSTTLIALAAVALAFAASGLYRRGRDPATCGADLEACRRSTSAARRWFWLVAVLTLIPIVVPLVAPLFY
jgi:mercuric ion transport protein